MAPGRNCAAVGTPKRSNGCRLFAALHERRTECWTQDLRSHRKSPRKDALVLAYDGTRWVSFEFHVRVPLCCQAQIF